VCCCLTKGLFCKNGKWFIIGKVVYYRPSLKDDYLYVVEINHEDFHGFQNIKIQVGGWATALSD